MSSRAEILSELGISPIWKTPESLFEKKSLLKDSFESKVEDRLLSSGQTNQLFKSTTDVVYGEGDEQAKWVFIALDLAERETQNKEPFGGDEGELLDNMLSAMKLKRDRDVYIIRSISNQDLKNITSESGEGLEYLEFIERKIVSLDPTLIVTLGAAAAQYLLGCREDLSALRRDLHEYQDAKLVATDHPSRLLAEPLKKADVWKDLCSAMDIMKKVRNENSNVSAL
ncbi:MAG: uracil-DNA glycosylase [Burkholderiales bacterium]|nr:uracil-DNA glycosylase [Burkholderiales bacterium]